MRGEVRSVPVRLAAVAAAGTGVALVILGQRGAVAGLHLSVLGIVFALASAVAAAFMLLGSAPLVRAVAAVEHGLGPGHRRNTDAPLGATMGWSRYWRSSRRGPAGRICGARRHRAGIQPVLRKPQADNADGGRSDEQRRAGGGGADLIHLPRSDAAAPSVRTRALILSAVMILAHAGRFAPG